MTPDPQTTIFSTAVLGIWAFLGGVMRGSAEWINPATGKLSPLRLFVAMATAAVLGQMAAAIGEHYGWDATWTGSAAALLGYLGPAVVMQVFQKRFLGATNAVPSDNRTKD